MINMSLSVCLTYLYTCIYDICMSTLDLSRGGDNV